MMISPEVIIAFLTGIVGPILLKWYENYLDKKKKDPILESNEFDVLILDELDELRKEFKADRVYIHRFHNGSYWYPAGSIQRFTMSHESVSENARSIKNKYVEVLISSFARTINKVYHNGCFYIPDFSENKLPQSGMQFIEDNDAKSLYLFSITDMKDRFIGIMGVEFTELKTYLSKDDINDLRLRVAKISGLLGEHLKQN